MKSTVHKKHTYVAANAFAINTQLHYTYYNITAPTVVCISWNRKLDELKTLAVKVTQGNKEIKEYVMNTITHDHGPSTQARAQVFSRVLTSWFLL